INHIERMGDQCVNIAKLIPLSGHEPPVREEILEKLLRMGRAARSEMMQARSAFASRDAALAMDLWRQDREINRLNRESFKPAIGAALACGLELLEALAIVLAVALTRRPREAVLGAVAAAIACGALGVVIGPVLVGRLAGAPLRLVVGVALLLFGLEWLRKGI